ncbi:hypothetical protein F2Q68_00043864 [Brassica cretica]|uniref:Uncharacterized protein n=1 Tax=Brassica cretica TaxID=69181 RepID=A0A8S9LQT4_BRACR|nr:hypothetical protein F2Q68_00043864 [Brassica cretica]
MDNPVAKIMQALDTRNASRLTTPPHMRKLRVVPRKEPCPSAGNTAALPPAKEPGKMLILYQGVLVFISSTHLEQMGEKGAGEQMFPLLFIQKKKSNLWVPGSNFQVPNPSFKVLDPSFRPP